LIDSFFDISDVDINISGAISTNEVGVIEPLPFPGSDGLGNKTFIMKYSVPMEVTFFDTTVYVTAQDSCANTYEYPRSWPGV